jgi:uncharacterized protein YjbJ (UPF0337 family)
LKRLESRAYAVQHQEPDGASQTRLHEKRNKIHQVKGAVKEKVGKATKNPELELEGQDEQTAGTVQKKVGPVEKVVGL